MGHRTYLATDRSRAAIERARPIAAVVSAAVVLLLVGWWLLRPATPPVEASLPLAEASPASPSTTLATTGPGAGEASSTTVPADIVVQAAGAVVHPGVYELPAGGRVADLVEAAGGLGPSADRERINLASVVADGQRVWIPRLGETAAPEVVAGSDAPAPSTDAAASAAPSSGAGGVARQAPLDLNTATAEELDTLPGVGPATAAAIIAQREASGGFRSVDDLLEVRGIGEAKLEQIRPQVRV